MMTLAACSSKNSDGSDATTYFSCSITDSSARLSEDRAKDMTQCWDGVDIKEKGKALDWCRKKVAQYMTRYTVSHGFKYEVKSTNCPK